MLLLVLATACATAPSSSPIVATQVDHSPGATPELGNFDLTELALLVSGYEDPTELKVARAEIEVLAAPIIRQLRPIEDPEERARALLSALHRAEDPAALPLQTYDARATTLRDVITTRRYNCLSSAVLYALIGERVGLDVQAELLPTHARALVRLRRGLAEVDVPVETTSPQGFDPDPRVMARVLAQVAGPRVRGGRALVPDGGTKVTTHVLIGAMYVNRASIAQEAGDISLAEQLFARGESLADSVEMKRILRDQRAALLSQLGADDIMSGDRARLERGYRTMKVAAALSPTDVEIQLAVKQNVRAAAERLVAARIESKDEAGAEAIVDEASGLGLSEDDRAGLAAFAMSEAARLRATTGDIDGAVAAIDQALATPLSARDSKLKATLERNRVAALRIAAMTSAKSGDFNKSMQLISRLQSIPGLTGEQRELYASDRKRAIHAVAQKWIADGDYRGAAEMYREGLRLYPSDETVLHNLIAVLERLTLPMVEQGRCAVAEDVLRELAALDSRSAFPAKARLRCLMLRARDRLAKNDHAEAVALLEAAQAHAADDPLVVRNLALALLDWAADEAEAGRCLQAVELTRKIEALPRQPISRARVNRALGTCGR